MHYIYVYLDPRKKGSYSFGKYSFEYEPFYIGKGKDKRMYSHLRVAKGFKKGKEKNDYKINKIKSIITDGYEPIILKIVDNIQTNEEANLLEIEAISLIGKLCENKGPLLNIANGGDGGKVWHGDHFGKGKKLEEITNDLTAKKMRKIMSDNAKKRIGNKNSNFGNKWSKFKSHPTKGTSRSKEDKKKISEGTKKYFDNLSNEEYDAIFKKAKITKENIPDEIKQQWYAKISKTLKERLKYGLPEEHIKNLKKNNFKSLNKGNDVLKLTDNCKKKISEALKNRKFSQSHLDKLRKLNFEEFEKIIFDLIKKYNIKNEDDYINVAKKEKHLRLPIDPKRKFKNKWKGWNLYL